MRVCFCVRVFACVCVHVWVFDSAGTAVGTCNLEESSNHTISDPRMLRSTSTEFPLHVSCARVCVYVCVSVCICVYIYVCALVQSMWMILCTKHTSDLCIQMLDADRHYGHCRIFVQKVGTQKRLIAEGAKKSRGNL